MPVDHFNDEEFTRASFCEEEGDQCVRIARHPTGVAVRGTKNDVTLYFTPGEWAAFVAGVKAGEFDISN